MTIRLDGITDLADDVQVRGADQSLRGRDADPPPVWLTIEHRDDAGNQSDAVNELFDGRDHGNRQSEVRPRPRRRGRRPCRRLIAPWTADFLENGERFTVELVAGDPAEV